MSVIKCKDCWRISGLSGPAPSYDPKADWCTCPPKPDERPPKSFLPKPFPIDKSLIEDEPVSTIAQKMRDHFIASPSEDDARERAGLIIIDEPFRDDAGRELGRKIAASWRRWFFGVK